MKKYTRSSIMIFPAFMLVLLFFVFDANASPQLTISPSMPTSENDISILVSGEWPSGGGPALRQWAQDGQNIRIFATGILPGIPQPIVPYQFSVDIGHLSPGQYRVEYYIEIFAAPDIPPDMGTPPPLPVATLDFEVLAVSAPIPMLSARALTLLGILLLLISVLAPGGFFRLNRSGL